MQTTATNLTVRYAETDAQGVVHHANYLVWFEEGRSDFLRQQGLNYTDFEKAGYFVVVGQAELKYRSPAYYEDRLVVETTLRKMRGKILEFTYRIRNQKDELLAEGRTVHVVLGPDRRPANLPAELTGRLQWSDADE